MSRVAWLLAVLSLSLGGLYSDLRAEVDVPPLAGPVVDRTGSLSATDIETLTTTIDRLTAERGSQIAVLIVPTTSPETSEQFGIRVAEQWRIGRRGIDDGVIVLVATEDRTVRLEVGYGLEGALPDATAKRIIDEIIVPRFRAADILGGLAAGIEAIAAVIRGESLPAPTAESGDSSPDLITLIIIGTVLSALLTPLFGRVGGAAVSSIGSALIGLAIAAPLIAIIAGFMVFFFSLTGVGMGGRRGGYSAGGQGRSAPRSYSGGGGSFGGGGASGRW